jgi:hypothetical protein
MRRTTRYNSSELSRACCHRSAGIGRGFNAKSWKPVKRTWPSSPRSENWLLCRNAESPYNYINSPVIGRYVLHLTNKTMGSRVILVTTRAANVLRTIVPTGEPSDEDRQHAQRVGLGAASRRCDVRRSARRAQGTRGPSEESAEQEEVEERPDDLPDDVPAKATITIKEINNNRYYYWQWREGEKIRSQYKGPVNPDE